MADYISGGPNKAGLYLHDSSGELQQMSMFYTVWTDDTHATRNALLYYSTFPGGVAVGHYGFWSGDNIDGVAQIVVPDFDDDVKKVSYVGCAIAHSDGGTGVNSVAVTPSGSQALYNQDGDTLTCTIAADGSMSVRRTAGAGTFTASLWFMWV